MHSVKGGILEIAERQSHDFRHPQSGSIGQVQHGTVANAAEGVRIGRIQQCLELFPAERFDERLIEALERDGMHLASQFKPSDLAKLKISEKALEGSQSAVAGTHTVATLMFQVIKEVQDQINAEVADLQAAGPDPECFGCELDETLETSGRGKRRLWSLDNELLNRLLKDAARRCTVGCLSDVSGPENVLDKR